MMLRLFWIVMISIALLVARNHATVSKLGFQFKGLIGLPKFLKLHVMVVYKDLASEENFCLDFLPIDAANPEVVATIISGRSVPGEIRITKSSTSTGGAQTNNVNDSGDLYAKKLTNGFEPELNLYFNNCYHFAFHCLLRDDAVRKML